MERFNPRQRTMDEAQSWFQFQIQERRAVITKWQEEKKGRNGRGFSYEADRAEKEIGEMLTWTEEMVLQRLNGIIQQKQEERVRRWGVMTQARTRYVDCTLDNYNAETDAQKAALARIKRFAEKLEDHIANGVNVVLFGPCGTGKDHLLTGLLRIVVMEFAEHIPIYHFRGCELAARAKEDRGTPLSCTFGESPDKSILAISDPVLPGEAAKYYELQRLYELIDSQYQNRCPSWVTVNASSRDELDAMLTPPVADRLVDGAFTVFCDWPSHRRKGSFA